MGYKLLLYIGIVLLTIGVVLSIVTAMELLPLVFIFSGVACKVFYIAQRIISGEYQAGWEFLYLAIGLILFLGGIYLSNQTEQNYPHVMKIAGLTLKGVFVILFILKSRKRE